jgi:YD repeat-containing protein
VLSQTDRSGKTISYAYDAEGRLQAVTGPFGRSLTFTYLNGRVVSLTAPGNQVYNYVYNIANDTLITVTYPEGTRRLYHYEDGALPNHLTGITDANGARLATYAYDTNGKAILTQRAGGQERFTLTYDTATQTTVTDAIGTQEIMTFEETLGVRNLLSRIHQVDGQGLRQVFDDNNNLIEFTDAEGRITTYTYNANNQRLTMTAAAGTPAARTTTFAYVCPLRSPPPVSLRVNKNKSSRPTMPIITPPPSPKRVLPLRAPPSPAPSPWPTTRSGRSPRSTGRAPISPTSRRLPTMSARPGASAANYKALRMRPTMPMGA